MNQPSPASDGQHAARDPRHGFRCSAGDLIALVAFGAASLGFWFGGIDLWWLTLFVAGHFFLFCNVFRIPRPLELAWAGAFLLNFAAWRFADHIAPVPIVLTQFPVTILILWLGIRRPDYHGIFARRWNPRLQEHLDAHPLRS